MVKNVHQWYCGGVAKGKQVPYIVFWSKLLVKYHLPFSYLNIME